MPESKAKGSMIVQSVIVSKEIASSAAEAKKKVPEGFSTSGVDETGSSFRFRQKEPGQFMPKSFRTKAVKGGISLVIGKLKEDCV